MLRCNAQRNIIVRVPVLLGINIIFLFFSLFLFNSSRKNRGLRPLARMTSIAVRLLPVRAPIFYHVQLYVNSRLPNARRTHKTPVGVV